MVHFRDWGRESHSTFGTGGRGSDSLSTDFPGDASGVEFSSSQPSSLEVEYQPPVCV